MLANASQEWRGFLAAGVYTGLRKGEVAGLRKADVALVGGTLMIRASYDRDTTKGGHADVIPLPEPLLPYVEAALQTRGSYLFPAADGSRRPPDSDPEKVLRYALARAHLVEKWVPSCRHCTHSGKPHGVDPHTVQRILRHASVTTTTRTYAHLTAEELRPALAAFGPARPLTPALPSDRSPTPSPLATQVHGGEGPLVGGLRNPQ